MKKRINYWQRLFYFLRAQACFELIQLVTGEPYESAEQAEKALGVPINEEITIMDNIYSRRNSSESVCENRIRFARVNHTF